VLRRCGEDLSRERVMKEAAHLDLALPMLLPGIRIKTAPDDFRPLKEMRLERFNGQIWIPFTPVISG
jgi:hypothetical protein